VRAIYKDIRQPEAAPRSSRRKKKEQPQLIVITADRNVGARYMLTDEIRVGRADNSDILIDDTYASQQHARIYSNEESYYVEDLGSTNGTYVNGRKTPHPLELRPGDRIKIGKTVFEFRR
jgi:pSer/pThr/pTyr-binding forkhead associated (FHA) protein